MADKYIGHSIELISKANIRYMGVMYTLDAENSTIALQNVRSFGSEGRRQGSEPEIAASDQVYPFIIFKAGDIKDLKILPDAGTGASTEAPTPTPAPVPTASTAWSKPEPAPAPSAPKAAPPKPKVESRRAPERAASDQQTVTVTVTKPVSSSASSGSSILPLAPASTLKVSMSMGGKSKKGAGGAESEARKPQERKAPAWGGKLPTSIAGEKETQVQIQPRPSAQGQRSRGNRGTGGRGGGYASREGGSYAQNYQPARSQPAQAAEVSIPNEAFDFNKMLEKFSKEDFYKEVDVGEVGGEQYQKDDFFDTMSCEATDRAEQRGRPDYASQRRLDSETFGVNAQQQQHRDMRARHYGRNGTGGRGGGGGGGYRQRGDRDDGFKRAGGDRRGNGNYSGRGRGDGHYQRQRQERGVA